LMSKFIGKRNQKVTIESNHNGLGDSKNGKAGYYPNFKKTSSCRRI
jgi:hypothetical protein